MLDNTTIFSKHNKMKHLINKASEAVDAVYNAADMERGSSRKAEHVKLLSATGVALCNHIKPKHAAKALGRDRTTVRHYLVKHNESMDYWRGYAERYAFAQEICDLYMRDAANDYEASMIDKRIAEYRKKISELELEKSNLI